MVGRRKSPLSCISRGISAQRASSDHNALPPRRARKRRPVRARIARIGSVEPELTFARGKGASADLSFISVPRSQPSRACPAKFRIMLFEASDASARGGTIARESGLDRDQADDIVL